MNRSIGSAVVAICLLFGSSFRSEGQIPERMSYQGRLLLAGELVNSNNMPVVLSIYNHPTAGTLLYQEEDTVDVVDGLFATTIGGNRSGGTEDTLLSALEAAGASAWLGVSVAGGPELSPRERITAAPYALVTDAVSEEHDPVWTNAQATGFTVAGPVNLAANGLAVGVNQLVVSGGEVGIGTANPVEPLDVRGDISMGGGSLDGAAEVLALRAENESWYVGAQNAGTLTDSGFFIGTSSVGNDMFHIQHDSKTGIGTSTPREQLEVRGPKARIRVSNTSQTKGGLVITDEDAAGDRFARMLYDADDGHDGHLFFYVNTNTPLLTLNSGQRVGVLTSTPGQELDVKGDVAVGAGADAGGPGEMVVFRAQNETWYVGAENQSGVADADFYISRGAGPDGTFHITEDGNIGMGTMDPSEQLTIEGSGASILLQNTAETATELVFADKQSPTQFADLLYNAGSADLWLLVNDPVTPALFVRDGITMAPKIGINTSDPQAELHVSGGPGSARLFLEADTDNAGEDNQPSILMSQDGGAVQAILGFDGGAVEGNSLKFRMGYSSGDIIFYTGTNVVTDQTEQMRVSHEGKVVVSVLEITGGADLAEPFDVNTSIPDVSAEPGMIVRIDGDHPGALAISDKPYDRRVAGVISGAGDVKPGMVMGQHDTAAAGSCAVALTGRVYCRADAAYGPIVPGDLLTTSATPGHAMKVKDYDLAAGAVLGKAMTSLDEGTGLVLVLVALQ